MAMYTVTPAEEEDEEAEEALELEDECLELGIVKFGKLVLFFLDKGL